MSIPDPTRTYGEPADPVRTVSSAYLLSAVGVGLLLAKNWRRLGRDEWVQPTRLIGVGVGAVSHLWIVLIIILAVDQSSLIWLVHPGIGIAFGLNFGTMYALVVWQRPHYLKWKNEGVQAMLAHEYDVRRPHLIFAMRTLGATIIFTLMYLLMYLLIIHH